MSILTATGATLDATAQPVDVQVSQGARELISLQFREDDDSVSDLSMWSFEVTGETGVGILTNGEVTSFSVDSTQQMFTMPRADRSATEQGTAYLRIDPDFWPHDLPYVTRAGQRVPMVSIAVKVIRGAPSTLPEIDVLRFLVIPRRTP